MADTTCVRTEPLHQDEYNDDNMHMETQIVVKNDDKFNVTTRGNQPIWIENSIFAVIPPGIDNDDGINNDDVETVNSDEFRQLGDDLNASVNSSPHPKNIRKGRRNNPGNDNKGVFNKPLTLDGNNVDDTPVASVVDNQGMEEEPVVPVDGSNAASGDGSNASVDAPTATDADEAKKKKDDAADQKEKDDAAAMVAFHIEKGNNKDAAAAPDAPDAAPSVENSKGVDLSIDLDGPKLDNTSPILNTSPMPSDLNKSTMPSGKINADDDSVNSDMSDDSLNLRGGKKRRKSSKKGHKSAKKGHKSAKRGRKSTRKGRKSSGKGRKSVKRGRKGKGSRRSKK